MTSKVNPTVNVSQPIDATLRMDLERVARQASSDDIKILARAILLLAKQAELSPSQAVDKRVESGRSQPVDVASNDSFPASDPPSFAGGISDANNRA